MIPNRFSIIYTVTQKEIFEHFKTKRLIVISIIFAIVFLIVAVYGHYLVGGGGGDDPAYEAGANEVLILMLAFTSLFPPILAIALSYDTIVGERTRRSLHLIVSKPVDRSSIFIGKFLGAFLSIAIVYLVVGTIGYIVVIILSNDVPSATEIGNAYTAMAIILFSAACWVLFIMLFSTSFKTITSTIIFSVMFWLFILSLLSMSGLIYYSIATSTADEPINVDLIIVEDSFLGFSAHRLEMPITNVDIELITENGTSISPQDTAGNELLPLFSLSSLEPGNYTWKATIEKNSNGDKETIDKGSFFINENFLPMISLTTLDNDKNYNDLVINIRGMSDYTGKEFDITVTSKRDNEIIDQELEYQGLYILKDLDEADYRITVTRNNTIFLNGTVHSYGSIKSQTQMFLAEDEDVTYPDYVKITYAMNPDNAASIYYQILSDDSDSGILSINESLIALSLEFIILFTLGLLIFSKIELL